MELEIHQRKQIKVAEYKSKDILSTVDDIVDLLGNANYLGATSMILDRDALDGSFFDLKSGIAGDILQKFSNYRCRLAIIGDFTNIKSKSLRDFIGESNRHGLINFVGSKEEAIDLLVGD